MTRTRKPRTGTTMIAVLRYVASHPGCTQQEVAIVTGPHHSHQFGARSVQRCLRAGLIADSGLRKNAYELAITLAGRAELAVRGLI